MFSNKPDFKKADFNAFKTLLDTILPDPEKINIENIFDLNLLVKQVTSAIEEADIKIIPRHKYRSLSKKYKNSSQNKTQPCKRYL